MLTKTPYLKVRGNLFFSGAATLFLSSFLCIICSAQPTNYQRLLSFGPTPQSGTAPRGRLLQGLDGFLYGTTYAGGSSNLGTIFKVGRQGSNFTVLHSFSDGEFPYAGLIQDSDGTLYGTTTGG